MSWPQTSRCTGEVQSLPLIFQGADRCSLTPGTQAMRNTGRGCRDTQPSPHRVWALGVPTSTRGLEPSTFSSMLELPQQPLAMVKSLTVYLAHPVFPASHSPLMVRDWFFPNLLLRDMGGHTTSQRNLRHFPPSPRGFSSFTICLKASSATAEMWGSMSPSSRLLVGVNHLLLIDGQQLVGVDGDEHGAWRKRAVPGGVPRPRAGGIRGAEGSLQ